MKARSIPVSDKSPNRLLADSTQIADGGFHIPKNYSEGKALVGRSMQIGLSGSSNRAKNPAKPPSRW